MASGATAGEPTDEPEHPQAEQQGGRGLGQESWACDQDGITGSSRFDLAGRVVHACQGHALPMESEAGVRDDRDAERGVGRRFARSAQWSRNKQAHRVIERLERPSLVDRKFHVNCDINLKTVPTAAWTLDLVEVVDKRHIYMTTRAAALPTEHAARPSSSDQPSDLQRLLNTGRSPKHTSRLSIHSRNSERYGL